MNNDKQTMADVTHTHPHTGETFGDAYRRGPAVADGGDEAARGDETMRGVTHDSEVDGAKRVWARGTSTETDEARGDRVNE